MFLLCNCGGLFVRGSDTVEIELLFSGSIAEGERNCKEALWQEFPYYRPVYIHFSS